MGIGQVALILGVVALILGGSGLAIALTRAGSAGATGAAGSTGATGTQGPPGPAGPGAIVNSTYVGPSAQINNTSCIAELGADVGFKATVAGVVVVTVTVTIFIDHTSGDLGDVALFLSSGPASCPGYAQYAFVANAEPTAYYYISVSLVETFAIPSAGTYTYYLVGYDIGTEDAFYYTTTIAGVYYPS
jgi:hypothetical protein